MKKKVFYYQLVVSFYNEDGSSHRFYSSLIYDRRELAQERAMSYKEEAFVAAVYIKKLTLSLDCQYYAARLFF